MPQLTVLSLTESFAFEWPRLAVECGLELVAVDDAAALDTVRGGLCLIAAAGAEDRLEPTLLGIVQGESNIAAVGSDADHRLAGALARAGAAEYFALPEDYELLRAWLREGAARMTAAVSAQAFSAGERAKYLFDGILGESAALKAALDRAGRVIPHTAVTVLIAGETGTGKELLARAIHYNGPRRAGPFVDVNCAAIPDQLLESELFGHEKGSFTGATAAKPGLFELARGGTIFLDEIAHLALPLQGKLLRALQERVVRRVGGTRNIEVDVRVIAATHVDLAGAVKRGEFREDLYYRLNVVPLALPPLRARVDDIVPLARHFLAHFAAEYGLPSPTLAPEAVDALRSRSWPGNVRELRNAMERAVVLAEGPVLHGTDVAESVHEASAGGIPFPAPLDDIVRAAVERTLDLCGGNKSKAAQRLGISRPRLLRLLHGRMDDTQDSPELPEGREKP